MSKNIESYNDLLEEKQRLEVLLASHKVEIKQNWEGVKHSLTPVTNVFSFFGKMTSRKHLNPVFDYGIDLAGDVLLRKLLLSKADWVTRLVLPIFIKNYSSNVLGGVSGRTFFGKLRTILTRKKGSASHSSDATGTETYSSTNETFNRSSAAYNPGSSDPAPGNAGPESKTVI